MASLTRLAAGLVLAWGLVTGPSAMAQQNADANPLYAEFTRLYQAGKYAEAISVAEKALVHFEKALGPDNPQLGTALGALAEIYRQQGDLAKAESMFKRSLPILEKALGSEHSQVGFTLSGLAALYLTQGRYGETEPLYKRALAIYEKALGLHHPDLCVSLNNLGILYQYQGRHAEAEPFYQRSLAILEKAADHPQLRVALNGLGGVKQALGHYGEAERLYRRSLEIHEKALGPEHAQVGFTLSGLAALYLTQGRYGEAEPLYKRALAINEKTLGPHHPDLSISLNNMGILYQNQARHSEAEPFYQRSLAILENAADHPQLRVALNGLGDVKQALGHYGEAERLYRHSLEIHEKALGPDSPEVGTLWSHIAKVYLDQGRYAEAEPLYARNVTIQEKAFGPDHLNVSAAVASLAELYREQGRYNDAERLYKRSKAIKEKALGANHPSIAADLSGLAAVYYSQGNYVEAEPLYKQSLAIRENALGPDHPEVGGNLSNLALLYAAQGRYAEAEPLYKRAIDVWTKGLGPTHRWVGTAVNNLAKLYRDEGRYAEAEPLYLKSLEIREKALGPEHPEVAITLNNLGALYVGQGRLAEAEPPFKRSLVIWEKVFGNDGLWSATALNNLAMLYQAQGRNQDAEPFFTRSLAIWERELGSENDLVATSLGNLGELYFSQRDWLRAADYWRRGSGVIEHRVERGSVKVGSALVGKSKTEAVRASRIFVGLVKADHLLAADGAGRGPGLANDAFQTAQWAQSSEAATSLMQMAARGAKGDSKLAEFVRRRQDLVEEWQERDGLRSAAVAQAPDKRDRAAEAANMARLAEIDTQVAQIDGHLAETFPDYDALTSSKPLSVTDAQSHLRDGEALVLFLDTPDWKPAPEETFIWVVTNKGIKWVRSNLGSKVLGERVAALRCGLDEEAWSALSQAARCGSLLGIDQPAGSDPLPFSLEIAHELYQALFGEVADLIKGKRLLIVPSGPLTSLPFQVLVTKKPDAALPKAFTGYRGVNWLVREHAVTVLPSVSSLKALREHAKSSASAKAYIGYGNPVLEGDGSCKEIKAPDTCPGLEVAGAELQQVAAAEGPVRATVRGRAGRRSPDLAKVFAKGGEAEAVLAQVRALCPLPDTAYEIGCVAERLGVPRSEIRLDAAATEADLKALSESGALANYRVVHFATHGLLAGDVEAMAKVQGEPALVLTPPQEPKDADDNGLLTASEVTQLKLNADWIVLSACNTASGDKLGAGALSGLARAFFYAGARTLLVSHWPVYSDAAVRLTTRAFAEMEQDKTVGRAEAFQRAMLTLMDDRSQDDNAHPAVWAPFVVVGEGAR